MCYTSGMFDEEQMWQQQWQEHAYNFKDGHCCIDQKLVPQLGKQEILMEPGPGFGDLSHPTTRLMVSLMDNLEGKSVLDVGCGSGVLSLIAAKFGAKVCGVDIDPKAIAHAKKNAAKNNLEITFLHIDDLKEQQYDLILLNMIHSEQQQALATLEKNTIKAKEMLVSGLMEAEVPDQVRAKTLEGWAAYQKYW